MSNQDILATLTGILRDLLGNGGIVLTETTERADIPGWNSFAYVNFIIATEGEFGVRFRVADVEAFETVGDIVRRIHELKG